MVGREFIGRGVLDWPSTERVTDRYGVVNLSSEGENLPIDVKQGRQGTLIAVVERVRPSVHIGDLFRGLGPGGADEGDEIVLGQGELFTETCYETDCVGVRPGDGREYDWMDPKALYRCHNQEVALYFEVSHGE